MNCKKCKATCRITDRHDKITTNKEIKNGPGEACWRVGASVPELLLGNQKDGHNSSQITPNNYGLHGLKRDNANK